MKRTILRPATEYSKDRRAVREHNLSTGHNSPAKEPVAFALCVLVLCLLPVEWVILPFGLKVTDFALVLVTLYGLGKAWRTRQRFAFPLLLSMWLILLASLIATLAGLVLLDSIVAIVQEVYLFIWFLVLTNVLRVMPSSGLDRLMKVWSVIASAEAIATLMGMLRIGPSFFYTSSFDGRILSYRGLTRAVGTYVNPNAAAAYLSISFFVLLATSWPAWLRSVLGIWLLAGMVGTGSMAALFSTVASFAILLLLVVPNQNRRTIALRGGIVGIGVGLVSAMMFILGFGILPSIGFGSNASLTLFALTVGRLPRSLAGRFVLVERAWSTYILHPWGAGPNSSAYYVASLHNDYVAFLFERGPLGVIGWVGMVGSTLLSPLRAAYQNPDKHQRWRLLALGSGFLACAMNAFVHEISHFRQVWVLIAFIFAAVYVYSARSATVPSINAESTSNEQRVRGQP